MIIKNRGNDQSYNPDELMIVVAKYDWEDRSELMVMREKFDFYPLPIDAADATIIDKTIPDYWNSKKYTYDSKECVITSFPEWANDALFYNWLIEDQWQPDNTRFARSRLEGEYDRILNFYAIKWFGAVVAAKQKIIELAYNNKLQLWKERGYEEPESLVLDDGLLMRTEFDINDLYEVFLRG